MNKIDARLVSTSELVQAYVQASRDLASAQNLSERFDAEDRREFLFGEAILREDNGDTLATALIDAVLDIDEALRKGEPLPEIPPKAPCGPGIDVTWRQP